MAFKPQIKKLDRVGDDTSGGSEVSGYSLQNQELTDTYAYVGYEHETYGTGFIYRRTRSNNLREYATITSDYATAWAGRAGLSYS